MRVKDEFLCVCGNTFLARKDNILSGHTTSCGCKLKEVTRKRSTTHGLSKHPLYVVWNGMKHRCYNKNGSSYGRYGGRGIIVCKLWKDSFINFYNWAVKNGWKKGLTIDREKNDKNYTPTNCRFISYADNNRNQSTTKLNWNKVKQIRKSNLSVAVLSKKYNVTKENIYSVINNKSWVGGL